MIRLAFCNLFQNKVRLVISAGGVALALLLVLAMDAVFTGVERQITAYIENSGADVWVSQEDVLNMHMASSTLPDSVARKIRHMAGVSEASPIDYLTANVVSGDERSLAYIIGLPEGAMLGGPWEIVAGRSLPEQGEAILDASIAEKSGLRWAMRWRSSGRISRWWDFRVEPQAWSTPSHSSQWPILKTCA